MKPLLDRDKLHMLHRQEAAVAAINCLNGVQNEKPEVQLAGIALLFAVFANTLNYSPEELYHIGRKIERGLAGHGKENVLIETLGDFAKLRTTDETKA